MAILILVCALQKWILKNCVRVDRLVGKISYIYNFLNKGVESVKLFESRWRKDAEGELMNPVWSV